MFGVVWLIAGCETASPLVASALTDDGRWRVSIEDPSLPLGEQAVSLSVEAAEDGAPEEEATVTALAGMPDMAHSVQAAACALTEPGVYTCALTLDMPGLWNLEGTITPPGEGAAVASFVLVVEAQ